MKLKIPLMVCTNARGGMRSVVDAYERDGIFKRWQFQWLWTHCEGSPIKKMVQGMKAFLKMLILLIQGKVSFLHLHSAMRGSFWRKSLFMVTAKLFGVPCILHLHGSEMKTFYNGLSVLGKRSVRWSLEHADVVIVLSESWKAFVLQAAPKAKVSIINNYVSLPKSTLVAKNNTTFNVLFLGVLGHRKGVFDLLATWPEVIKKVPHARLLIGGNGEVEKSKLMAKNLGINESVDFLGWIDGDKKAELLKNANAFVLPSYNEGLPMSVLEAMSYKTPVITTNVGGIPELISNGINGILIVPGDQAELADALINFGQNIDLRLLIATAGQQRVEAFFSDKVILPKLEQIYANIER
jgi:glycosyltransferase involved in cell wall biosynthesis